MEECKEGKGANRFLCIHKRSEEGASRRKGGENNGEEGRKQAALVLTTKPVTTEGRGGRRCPDTLVMSTKGLFLALVLGHRSENGVYGQRRIHGKHLGSDPASENCLPQIQTLKDYHFGAYLPRTAFADGVLLRLSLQVELWPCPERSKL